MMDSSLPISSQTMSKKISVLLKKIFNRPFRIYTHCETIEYFFQQNYHKSDYPAIFIETGSGTSTLGIARIAKKYNATFYSCDIDEAKIDNLVKQEGSKLENVNFLRGDSLKSLKAVADLHEQIHFAFFDSAASAMHTFKEFMTVESRFKEGSIILIDNASMPYEKEALLTVCRKGKVLVPYLLASRHWIVKSHPHSGDSMVSAVYSQELTPIDSEYEEMLF